MSDLCVSKGQPFTVNTALEYSIYRKTECKKCYEMK